MGEFFCNLCCMKAGRYCFYTQFRNISLEYWFFHNFTMNFSGYCIPLRFYWANCASQKFCCISNSNLLLSFCSKGSKQKGLAVLCIQHSVSIHPIYHLAMPDRNNLCEYNYTLYSPSISISISYLTSAEEEYPTQLLPPHTRNHTHNPFN